MMLVARDSRLSRTTLDWISNIQSSFFSSACYYLVFDADGTSDRMCHCSTGLVAKADAQKEMTTKACKKKEANKVQAGHEVNKIELQAKSNCARASA